MFDVTEPIGGVHGAGRLGYRSGYYSRSLTTRVGVLGLAFRVIRSQAVLVAIGVDREGRRNVLGVDPRPAKSGTSRRDFLAGLKARGLDGVEFAVSDNHEGLKRAIRETLPRPAGAARRTGLDEQPSPGNGQARSASTR